VGRRVPVRHKEAGDQELRELSVLGRSAKSQVAGFPGGQHESTGWTASFEGVLAVGGHEVCSWAHRADQGTDPTSHSMFV